MTDKTQDARASLIFHGIGEPRRPLEQGEAVYWLSRSAFCSLLDQIHEMGPEAPEITFDDGNASDIEIALPELQKRGLRAVFFLLTSRLDQQGSLTCDDVRCLAENGQTIGLHGHAHRDWRKLDASARNQEYRQARSILSDLAKTDVGMAAAPFGYYDRNVVNTLKTCGFEALYTSDWGRASSRRFIRPRNCIDSTMTTDQTTAALNGTIALIRRPRRLVGLARKRFWPLRLAS
jgi:peptidoglycan/xylan/chitin deacetylase (PgdA/CDA1 family)